MKKKQVLPEALQSSVLPASPAVPSLPFIGKSRWSKIAPFSPYSKETFRKLSKEGRAPQPERFGLRCTFYDNKQIHMWLADPIGYKVSKED